MLTAGPIGSVAGACRSLYMNCARVSLTVRDERRQRVADGDALIEVVEPAEDADGALVPPAPRELVGRRRRTGCSER